MTTKQYLRFSPENTFGIVASSNANIVPIRKTNGVKLKDNFFAVPACEDVYVWNLRTKEKVQVLNGEKVSVASLTIDANDKNIAVGYTDGTIRIFDLKTAECVVSFIGHKSAVSCLTFEDVGSYLASGGKDTEIVLWNITDEAGVFRLKGHKGPITRCIFFKDKNVLLSSSKDTYVKFWDLDIQHCFYTLVGCQYEVLDMSLIKGSYLICGLNSQKLRIWNICKSSDIDPALHVQKRLKITESIDSDSDTEPEKQNEEHSEEDEPSKLKAIEIGDLPITENRTSAIVVDPNERLLGVHGNTKTLRLYKILNKEEINRKLRKKRNKELKRKKSEDDDELDESASTIENEFRVLKPIQVDGKIDSFSLSVDDMDMATITILLKNNSISQYELDLKVKDSEPTFVRSVSIPGHRSFVRTLSCSSDGSAILSVSDESLKIWRSLRDEFRCTSTLPCDTAFCSLFVPGNNYCVIGTKKGNLDIFDIDRRCLINSVEAHEGSVQCMCLSPGERGITSGGKDKAVKFWDFELVRDQNTEGTKKLSLIQTRALEMPEEILCVKYTPDGNKIAVALLDFTVQVLFSDSLKLAFSLYGHEFPVTCLDISYDSTLIVTGSNDRTIRIWSLEFGSCNKRIRIKDEKGQPHDKGITCIQFLPKSHLFFSGSKDHLVRQWDADNFQRIITLKGHQNELTAMAVSPSGTYVVTASKDRSIRTWEKTAEPLILQEERETEAEEREKEVEDLPSIPGEKNKEVALPGMKTAETIKTVDQLIEALELYLSETKNLEQYEAECVSAGKKLPPPPVHPLFMAYKVTSPLDYIRKAFKRIKPSELEGALLHLPFNYVLDYLKVLAEFAERGWETEFSQKCSTFLVRVNFGQISSSNGFGPVIEKLKENLFKNMYHIRDVVGFTKVVSNLHHRAIEAREEVSMFSGLLDNLKKKKKKIRRKQHGVVAFV